MNASVGSLVCGGDLGVAMVPADEAVEGRGGVVAEDGVWAAGLDGGEEAAFQWNVGVARGVDPAVKGVELTVPHPDGDRIEGEPASAQFVRREHAPLARGELGDPDIGPSGRLIRLRRIK